MDTILLLNPPGTRIYFRDYYCSCVSKAKYYYHPVDLLYLSGTLSEAGYLVKVIDAIAESLDNKQTDLKIKEISPDIIIFLTSAPSYEEDVAYILKLKSALPDTKFIGSGDVYREIKEKAFELNKYLDAVLLNFSTKDILLYLDKANGLKINNIIYKHGTEIVVGENKRDFSEYEIPLPRWSLFNLPNYKFPFNKKKKWMTVLTDYGCPYSCTFCPMSTLGFKIRSVDSVIKELTELKNSYGITEIFFRDQTFGVNKERTFNLLEQIISNKLNISWTAFSRVDVVDEILLKKMKEAGCHTIMYGVETADEELLDAYKKNIKINRIKEALKISKEVGIRTVGTFIIGFPEETKESIKRTIELSITLGLDFASFNIATPRFGTTFRKGSIDGGLINPTKYNIDSAKSKPSWNENKVLTNEDIFSLQKEAIRRFYFRIGYLTKRLFNTRSIYEFKENLVEGTSLLIDVLKQRLK